MVDWVVSMVNVGCKYVVVLGVDFMFENVCVIFDCVGCEEVCYILCYVF